MLAAGAGRGGWRGSPPPWCKASGCPSHLARLNPCLTFCLPVCVSLSLSLVSLGLSHVSAISGGFLAWGDIPLVSVAGLLALHRCWVQHNSTPGPLGLWNCLSPSHPVCVSLSLSSPSPGALILIHFWELMSHPGSLIPLLVL